MIINWSANYIAITSQNKVINRIIRDEITEDDLKEYLESKYKDEIGFRGLENFSIENIEL